jgi:hypothetical protein
MSFAFTINFFTILVLVTAVLAIIDGVSRARGKGGILPIITIVLGALLALSQFIVLPFGLLIIAILLLIALVIVLVTRGGVKRGSVVITLIAIVLDAVIILNQLDWLHIPGLF